MVISKQTPCESRRSQNRAWWRTLCGLLIPVVLLPLPFLWQTKEGKCAFVILWLAGYWVTEAIPIEMTALMPIALFPALGLLSTAEVCLFFGKDILFFFIGGMMTAIAMEESNLHKRIALKTLLLLGTGTKRMLLGFMLICMFLSMWLSNTSCVVMMAPVVDAILEERNRICRLDSDRYHRNDTALSNAATEKQMANSTTWVDCEGDRDSDDALLRKVMLLSLAYSASCGATGTTNGGGPNIVFLSIFEQLYPQATELTYLSWMAYNVPGMLVCVLGGWCVLFLLHRRAFRDNFSDKTKASVHGIVESNYQDLGPFSFREGAVSTLLLFQICLWIFMEPQFIPGWAMFFEKKIKNASPSLAVPVLLFLLPSDIRRPGSSPRLLEWTRFQHQMPWGLVLLVGGGLAVAGGAQETGLSRAIGDQLVWLRAMPPGVAASIVCLLGAMLTELLSNTAASTMIMPILAQLAQVLRVNPMYFMLPVSVCCSFAFMLPVATPPNAYVYERSNMKMSDMIKPGLVMNLLCVSVELVMINTWGVYLFSLNQFPVWADMDVKANASISTLSNTADYNTSLPLAR